ncbi:MAG: iron ABC transporter permease [Magnetospirillum sp.]|nr:iron ABC transporter permease [Magnetospirillum sp.]
MIRPLPLLAAALAVAVLVSLSLGPAPLTWADMLRALAGDGDPRMVLIVQQIRLPRALMGVMVGGALGMTGAALQGLLRNPLAEPGIIGTSAAAGLGAVIALYFGWAGLFAPAVPLAAMTAAALATVGLLAVAGRQGETLTMILAGIAVSSLAVALTSLAMNLSPNPFALSEMVLWLLGSLKDRSLDDVALAAPFMAAGAALLMRCRRGLDALTLGEETAASLGVSLRRLRLAVVAGTALAVGAAVAAVGSVGFVGLVVPHLLRPLVRHRPSALLVPCALGGGVLVTVADVAVRVIPSHSELMLGVVTSLVGAPFFLALILRTRRGWHDRADRP